jgi:hypothetical protein
VVEFAAVQQPHEPGVALRGGRAVAVLERYQDQLGGEVRAERWLELERGGNDVAVQRHQGERVPIGHRRQVDQLLDLAVADPLQDRAEGRADRGTERGRIVGELAAEQGGGPPRAADRRAHVVGVSVERGPHRLERAAIVVVHGTRGGRIEHADGARGVAAEIAALGEHGVGFELLAVLGLPVEAGDRDAQEIDRGDVGRRAPGLARGHDVEPRQRGDLVRCLDQRDRAVEVRHHVEQPIAEPGRGRAGEQQPADPQVHALLVAGRHQRVGGALHAIVLEAQPAKHQARAARPGDVLELGQRHHELLAERGRQLGMDHRQ